MTADVLIIMGSKSDEPVGKKATAVLKDLGIPHKLTVASAHRTPKWVEHLVETSDAKVFITIAGLAAALPGAVASHTTKPVIGVPVKSRNSIDGWDSVLSILQMPGGVPVATVALDGAKNAGILAAQIIASGDPVLLQRIVDFKEGLKKKVMAASKKMKS